MYIYGKNVCCERINSNDKIVRAYVSNKFRDRDIVDKLFAKKVKVNFVDNKVLDKKVDGNHQWFFFLMHDIKTYTLDNLINIIKDKDNPLVVMLDHLEDPHNFGAIIRTCEALGIDGIIIPNDRSVRITSTVIKTSVGATDYVKIIRVANLQVAIKKLKENGFWIVGTDMHGDDYTKLDYNLPICLVIGNEGHGMSGVVKNNCDFIATIPMSGKINSLNASVSCGIILSQIVNSRR